MMRTEFSYPSSNGLNRIKAYVWAPEPGIELRGVVSLVHGLAEHAQRYEPLARFLNCHGYIVVAEDHLGHGRSVEAADELGYWGVGDAAGFAILDIHQLRLRYQTLYPKLPYYMLGHSMGSLMLRAYLCEYGADLTGAILIGTTDTPGYLSSLGSLLAHLIRLFRGERHHSKLLADLSVSKPLARIPNAKTEYDWLSFSEDNVRNYIADPLCGFPFTVNGHLALYKIASRMSRLGESDSHCPKDMPLLFLAGAEDPIARYGEAPAAVVRQLESRGFSRIERKVYPEVRHEILNDIKKQEVMDDILAFLEQTNTLPGT